MSRTLLGVSQDNGSVTLLAKLGITLIGYPRLMSTVPTSPSLLDVSPGNFPRVSELECLGCFPLQLTSDFSEKGFRAKGVLGSGLRA